MAEIDEINQRLEDCVDEAEAIKTKIKDVAESKGITVVDGTDTPITALTKIDNATVPTPTGTINITQNGSNIDVSSYAKADVLVQSQDSLVVKGLADGSLTSFKASDYGVTSLKNRRFDGFSSLQSLDLTGVTNIPEYTAYNCTGLTSLILDTSTTNIGQYAFYGIGLSNYNNLNIILNFNVPVSIGNYAFRDVRSITKIKGTFNNIGTYAFYSNSQTLLNEIDIKVNGSIGQNAFCSSHLAVSIFKLDPSSDITSLGNYAFAGLGVNRVNPQSNVFTFDFRNSTFLTVPTGLFAGNSSNQLCKYFDIYFPNTLSTINTNIFTYTDHFNIYYKNIPTLSNVNAFGSATNFKNFFPYNLVQTAKTATNWTSSTNGINASIYGYSDANEFSLGDTLPVADNDGYALTWYSDRDMTTQVTTVSDPTQMYYCQVGSKIKVKLSTTQFQATLTVSDGTNTYTNGDLVPIGATLTITAVGDGDNTQAYTFTLNGATIASGDTYTVAQDDVAIVCIYYDGVNPPIDPVFANNIPAQIKIAVDNGLHRIFWTIGDTKTIALTNGNTATVVYRDQQANRYEKVDGTGYSNAVFEIIPMQAIAIMNSSSTDAGGWAASRMCTTTMAEIYDLLPSDWQAIISEVKIPSTSGGSSSTIVYANNKVFIPSGKEIFGNSYVNQYYYDEGCAQFDWYSTNNTAADRIRQYNNTNTAYWLRSPAYGSSSGFSSVGTSGYISNTSANNFFGVLPIFTI